MTKTTAAKTAMKYVGRTIADLADGRTLEPGQEIDMTEETLADPHNQRLVDDGLLIAVQTKKED